MGYMLIYESNQFIYEVWNQIRLKLACSATGTSLNWEN